MGKVIFPSPCADIHIFHIQRRCLLGSLQPQSGIHGSACMVPEIQSRSVSLLGLLALLLYRKGPDLPVKNFPDSVPTHSTMQKHMNFCSTSPAVETLSYGMSSNFRMERPSKVSRPFSVQDQ